MFGEEEGAARPARVEPGTRVKIDVHYRADVGPSLAEDARQGLTRRPKSLPPKYFYDTLGSQLFDQICDTKEYYPTRTEHALLNRHGIDIIEQTRPEAVVELGSGAARKTRALLDALSKTTARGTYVPVDVGEDMLRSAARKLAREYPWLRVHGVIADYERQLPLVPAPKHQLLLFMGSTLGNFSPTQATGFLSAVRRKMNAGDFLLLGLDLVKDKGVLNAAYNDAQGLTASFNKNVLTVLNRNLGADFDLDRFVHVAEYNAEDEQMEMYLESAQSQTIHLQELGLSIELEQSERILTEISRKFTRASAERMLGAAHLEIVQWYPAEEDYFAVILCRPIPLETEERNTAAHTR